MTDPAVEAALRALSARADNRVAQGAAAAREALAPIREMHETWRDGWKSPPTWDVDGHAHHAMNLLLDDLARLIYSTDELEKQ